jgi:hypothetical protein
MQHDDGEGARQRSGADDTNPRGAAERTVGNAAVHPYPQANENRIHLLHGTVVERVPRQVRDLANLFTEGAAGLMAAGLQEALPCVAGNVL